jgi:hypothetical protein
MADHPNPVPLQTILLTLAAQTHALAGEAGRIEHAVAEISALNSTPGPEARKSLQALDLLVQSLEALSTYMEVIARDVEPTAMLDPTFAAEQIKLRGLANALSGKGILPMAPQDELGDVHFF